MALTFSTRLTRLDLTDCKGMTDEAVRCVAHKEIQRMKRSPERGVKPSSKTRR